ncbi:unnamed protein product [Phytophthora fragariaefolia]|uniref:Unnamed protein product n=1 Tax=Phytophthora fragariaefolia TaxID=1490495 RepID=A0A9W6WXK3_9STRA|nr:unnamed protein product [Phytophthora fragariaefolia]
MKTEAELWSFDNKHHSINIEKKVAPWLPYKSMSPTRATGNKQFIIKHKNRSPQRMVSAASSAETITSQDDYGAESDAEDEECEGNKDDANVKKNNVYSKKTTSSFVMGSNNTSDEGCLHYEILLWYGSSLGGIDFSPCETAGYPYVKQSNGNESLPGMWNIQEGDFLVSVNECNTHSSVMSFDAVIEFVVSGARPAVLRFRRPNLSELQWIPTQKPRKPTSEERLERRRNREHLEKTLSYVIWREGDGPLGVSLKKQPGLLYPVLADMNRSSVVRRHANIGDQLISINQHDIYKLGSKRWVQLLKSGPKPLVLAFRRLRPPPNQKGARMLDL